MNRSNFFKIYLIVLILLNTSWGYSQSSVVLSGYITAADTNETLFGVNLIFPILNLGTTTNEYGFYS
ncbi:MAG: hypothetical protein ACPG14_07685, partial [Flavobacteriaceae bacterium]